MVDELLDSELNSHLQFLKEKAEADLQLELTDEHLTKFHLYTRMLLEWNERINLTAITEPREIIIKHFLDSLVFVKLLTKSFSEKAILLGDLGTGAGFPGIPIKILLPDLHVVLIDSLAKRINFLDEVCTSLSLTNIELFHARAEDAGRDTRYREQFDVIVARAVAELPVLLEYTVPLLKVGGLLLAAKGINPERELASARNALQALSSQLEGLERYGLAEEAEHRSLLMIKKLAHTPSKYPRQAGKPKKNPL